MLLSQFKITYVKSVLTIISVILCSLILLRDSLVLLSSIDEFLIAVEQRP